MRFEFWQRSIRIRGNGYYYKVNPLQRPGCWFDIKIPSYQYRISYWDKIILWPSYLHNGISYTGKTMCLYWIKALKSHVNITQIASFCWRELYKWCFFNSHDRPPVIWDHSRRWSKMEIISLRFHCFRRQGQRHSDCIVHGCCVSPWQTPWLFHCLTLRH